MSRRYNGSNNRNTMARKDLALLVGTVVVCTVAIIWIAAQVREPGVPSRIPSSEDGTATASTPWPAGAQTQQRPAGQSDLSETDVTLTTNASFLITDSVGRSAGRDAKTGKQSSDIPGSTYFEDRVGGEISHYAQLDRPEAGKYTILVTGVRDGPYILSIRVFSVDGSSQAPLSAKGSLKAGAEAKFLLDLDPSQNGKSTLTNLTTERP